jgi:hypothetical protein
VKRVAAVIAAALIAVLTVAGCSANAEVSIGGESFDRADMETTISEGLGDEAAGRPDPEVDCDGVEDLDVEDGNEFTCTGTAPNGEQFPIEVVLTDDEGGYRYAVPPTGSSPADSEPTT